MLNIGGKLYPVLDELGTVVPVRRWDDGQLPKVPEFKAGDGYNKRRARPIDLFVFHWTGGENEPIQMADVLRKRSLGIETAISRSGTIYQFCDPLAVDTADAGIVNSRSIGCEIVCYGYASWDLTRRVFTVPKLGQDRETYEAVIHGKKLKVAKFYPAQMRAARALARVVSTAIPAIKRQVPAVTNEALSPGLLTGYSGFLGHYHITNKKMDPGPWFMDQLFPLGNV